MNNLQRKQLFYVGRGEGWLVPVGCGFVMGVGLVGFRLSSAGNFVYCSVIRWGGSGSDSGMAGVGRGSSFGLGIFILTWREGSEKSWL